MNYRRRVLRNRVINYGVYVVIVTIFCDNRCPKSFEILKLASTRGLVRGV